MHVDLVDPLKLDQARRLLGTQSTKATLDLALELLLAQSDFIEVERDAGEPNVVSVRPAGEWE